MAMSARTLSDAVLPRSRALPAGLLRDGALVLGGSLVVALLAQVSIPLQPVPVTGQTLGVLLVAAALGRRRGALAMLAYIAEGTLGLPVFAEGKAGPEVLAGPTGGYLVGFVLAAALVGALAERGWDRRPLTMGLAMVLGNLAIYALGASWLARWLMAAQMSTGAALQAAWNVGVAPFLLGDALKLIVAVIALPGAWALLRRLGAHGPAR